MTATPLLDIGEVVQQSGLPVSTLHLWEKRGLISPAGRDGLRRQYEPEVLERLAIVVLCQRAGFSLDEIGDLLRPEAFADGKQQLVDKLEQLQRRRAELELAITGLEHALACDAPSPLECDNSESKLVHILPVGR